MLDVVLVLALAANVAWYVLIAPYTKVEESFNVQAIHDVVYHGLDLAHFDHIDFPGVVPRTFLGALVLGSFAKALTFFKPDLEPEQVLVAVRLVLGLTNTWALWRFRAALVSASGKLRGRQIGNWFLIFTLGEFHLVFYSSRTLPNMLALPFVLIGFALALRDKRSYALSLLSFAAVIFRLEIGLLTAALGLMYVGTRRLPVISMIRAGLRGALPGIALSVAVDSHMWQSWTWPELTSLFYNVVQGKSVFWGVEPWHAYFSKHLPNLLGNPVMLVPAAIGILLATPTLRIAALAAASYVALYSLQPHKEWRFVIYVVPIFTALVAQSADYVFYRKWPKQWGKLVVLIMLGLAGLNICLSFVKAQTSASNYPGGVALKTLHSLPLDKTKTVHLDVATCMTGASRFGQQWPLAVYDKTEDPKALAQAWPSFDYYIGTASTSELPGQWRQLAVIPAFSHVNTTIIGEIIAHAKAQVPRAKQDFGGVVDAVKEAAWPPSVLFTQIKRVWSELIVTKDNVYIYERM